ncbi:MAG: mandelate racemase/muconate lactonizing enzyme family protein [Pirellulaceae bacterium]|jgi:L-alanine-DL-glutamate epimerase-like enolase superfamily enzyme|nr:mandelate racemase/muconate lactonizing enzyme family protein [Pirellulaceae bacterium]
MKISNLRATQPDTPGSPADWRTQLGQIVVEVTTDDGIAGIGVGGGGAAGVHIIQTVLADLLVGRDAEDVENLHAEMFRHTSFYGRVGLVVMAISGVDLALWDLRGKSRDSSVARLLNRDVDIEKPLPTYLTVFDDAEAIAAIRGGHRAIKLHVERFGDRPDPNQIAQLVADTRASLGDDAEIMIDAFARWDLETSLAVAKAIAPYRVAWLEEPLPPEEVAGYQVLERESPTPIAGGEHEYGAASFQEIAEQRRHVVLQPDINWCGGMTTLVQIYQIAAQHNLRVCPHRGCEPFALPAIAALDSQPLAESPRKWFKCLEGAAQICDGVIRLNDAAGFGVSVDPAVWRD